MQLQELKKKLDQCRLDLCDYQIMVEEREHTLERIHGLKENIETKLLQMHHLQNINPKKAERLKQEIEEQTEIVTELKKKLTKIDARLDLIGEEHETALDQLKATLVSEIQQQFPDTKEEYELLDKNLQRIRKEEKKLIHLKETLTPFYKTLKEGSEIKLKVGFLQTLIGNNPKARLSRNISKAAKIAEQIQPLITDPLFLQFLEKFLHEVDKPWNKELYNGKYLELFKEFSSHFSSLDAQITVSKRNLITQEQAIEIWLEKHCH